MYPSRQIEKRTKTLSPGCSFEPVPPCPKRNASLTIYNFGRGSTTTMTIAFPINKNFAVLDTLALVLVLSSSNGDGDEVSSYSRSANASRAPIQDLPTPQKRRRIQRFRRIKQSEQTEVDEFMFDEDSVDLAKRRNWKLSIWSRRMRRPSVPCEISFGEDGDCTVDFTMDLKR